VIPGREDATVLACDEIAPGVFELVIRSPRAATSLLPGQFVEVGWPLGQGPFLGRPMSYFRREGQSFSILFRVVGEGTALLARARAGDVLWVMGPLGHPYPRPEKGLLTLVGGGVGVPPLLDVARAHIEAGGRVRVLIGARNRADLLGLAELRATRAEVACATDDGSGGHKGPVTDLLTEADTFVVACGPAGMLRAVKAWGAASGATCHLALEAPMACGFGACLGCTVPASEPDPAKGAYAAYRRICTEGPAFAAGEVEI